MEPTIVWYVAGDNETACPALFSTKDHAEYHARVLFPDESADHRYSRIFFTVVDMEVR